MSKIKTALISVSDKTGIVEFAEFLVKQGVKILSTGGTAKTLRNSNIEVTDVSDITGFPEIMDGRVKTLHPKIHGGLLAKRNDTAHQKAMEEHDIAPIDMVVINLYPFEQTVAKGADFDECIENIDIGGPSMIRSAAKNHKDVAVVTNPKFYHWVMDEMDAGEGGVSPFVRQKLAEDAFTMTARYDGAISTWFSSQKACEVDSPALPRKLNISATVDFGLRYGENPHQDAALYVDNSDIPGVVNAEWLKGNELSYNNIADTDAAFDLVSEFTEPAVAIIKHANPCGVAVADRPDKAFEQALACDPVSAYGGIIALNRTLDKTTAALISRLFVEVIIAPDVDNNALEILNKKKKTRILKTGSMPDPQRENLMVKSVAGGFLAQMRDNSTLNRDELKTVTKAKPDDVQMEDLIFAFTVCKHAKSNAIVLAKNQATIGIGAGQMSRVDSTRIALWKARETATSVEDAAGSVLASDAFFPFADNVEAAAEAGISAIIQPGGSIRDEEVIAAADRHNIAMLFTGIRHFRH